VHRGSFKNNSALRWKLGITDSMRPSGNPNDFPIHKAALVRFILKGLLYELTTAPGDYLSWTGPTIPVLSYSELLRARLGPETEVVTAVRPGTRQTDGNQIIIIKCFLSLYIGCPSNGTGPVVWFQDLTFLDRSCWIRLS
jgi:hypothetical protein